MPDRQVLEDILLASKNVRPADSNVETWTYGW